MRDHAQLQQYIYECLNDEYYVRPLDHESVLELMACSEGLSRLGYDRDADIALVAAAFLCFSAPEEDDELEANRFKGARLMLAVVSRVIKRLQLCEDLTVIVV